MRIPSTPLFLCVVGLLLGLGLPPASAADKGLANPDLEEGELGEVPKGWFLPKPSVDAGFKAELVEQNPKTGKRCALISREDKAKQDGFGNLLQSIDAKPYRGQRIRFKAAVRAEVANLNGKAQLWLRVDRKGDQVGFFDNMGDRPITKKDWADYEIIGEVADDAQSIVLGLIFIGQGKAWLDAVEFEALGKIGEGNEPPKALTDRGLENAVAFTRLLGYVRYFHPSDEAAAVGWDSFAIDGMAFVEPAKNAAELAKILQRMFRPIAPTVRVFPTGEKPDKIPGLEPPKDVAKPRLLAWRHFGVSGGGAIYSSTRTNKDQFNKNDPPFPKPDEPFTADLGGGVSCIVPLALYADEKGTLPRIEPGKRDYQSPKPKGFIPTGNDRTTRLADVALAWNVFQHFYPYFDTVKVDWVAELPKALKSAATDADDLAFHQTLRRLAAALQDGHGGVNYRNSPLPFHPPFRCDYAEDKLVVTHVAGDGAGGLQRGDILVKVQGKPAKEALETFEQLISGATAQWKRQRSVLELFVGTKGAELVLEVQRGEGKTEKIALQRTLDIQQFLKLKEPRPAMVEEIKPGIIYVDLDRISDKDFQDALPKLEKAKGIIFDLRGYPSKVSTLPIGHLIDKAVTSAQWHVPVTVYPDRKAVAFMQSNWSVEPRKPRLQAKTAFLTDGRAISYAETYMGIIEHYQLAAIVGSPTAGTNGNVNPFTVPGGYQMMWTGMKVLKHDGSKHHGLGIQPTVTVSRTVRGIADGKDEVLQKAIEVVSK